MSDVISGENTFKVSIIVPVYNVEKYLRRCIDSILAQSYKNIELILVDDGSPDNSGAICDEYAQKDERVVVIHKKNGGVSAARNTGIDTASGEYIMFVDSDDSIDSGFLEHSIPFMRDIDLYVSGIQMLTYKNGELTEQTEYKPVKSCFLSTKELLEGCGRLYPMINICGPCCKLYQKHIIKDNNVKFDTALSCGEDTSFNLDYLSHCSSAYLDDVVFYNYYRVNENSLFSKYRPDTYEIHFKVYSKWHKVMLEHNCDAEALDRFNEMYLSLMNGAIVHIYQHTKNKSERKAVVKKVQNDLCVKNNNWSIGSNKLKIIKLLLKLRMAWTVRLIYSVKYR